MEDIDMRPGTEMFPEAHQVNISMDVNSGQSVGDPLDTGVNDVAGQEPESSQAMNFKALRDELIKFKNDASKSRGEAEYWKGKAQAYSESRQPEVAKKDDYESLDWYDGKDVQRAFHSMREENNRLRSEIKDTLAAVEAKSQRRDWNEMVTQHVPQLTSKNPIFAEMIERASNPYEAAYLLAELNSKAQLEAEQRANPMNGQRAVSNAQKPRSLASVGGNSQLSAADYYANMSEEEFNKLAAKNLAGI